MPVVPALPVVPPRPAPPPCRPLPVVPALPVDPALPPAPLPPAPRPSRPALPLGPRSPEPPHAPTPRPSAAQAISKRACASKTSSGEPARGEARRKEVPKTLGRPRRGARTEKARRSDELEDSIPPGASGARVVRDQIGEQLHPGGRRRAPPGQCWSPAARARGAGRRACWFWLSFSLPSSRSTAISKPTIAPSSRSTQRRGQRIETPRLRRTRARARRRDPSAGRAGRRARAARRGRGRGPPRSSRSARSRAIRVPRRRHVGSAGRGRSPAPGCRSRAASSAGWRARRDRESSARRRPRRRRSSTGTCDANGTPSAAVTTVANPFSRMTFCRISGRAPRRSWAGTFWRAMLRRFGVYYPDGGTRARRWRDRCGTCFVRRRRRRRPRTRLMLASARRRCCWAARSIASSPSSCRRRSRCAAIATPASAREDVTLVDARYLRRQGREPRPLRRRAASGRRDGSAALPALDAHDCRGKLDEVAKRLAAAPDAGRGRGRRADRGVGAVGAARRRSATSARAATAGARWRGRWRARRPPARSRPLETRRPAPGDRARLVAEPRSRAVVPEGRRRRAGDADRRLPGLRARAARAVRQRRPARPADSDGVVGATLRFANRVVALFSEDGPLVLELDRQTVEIRNIQISGGEGTLTVRGRATSRAVSETARRSASSRPARTCGWRRCAPTPETGGLQRAVRRRVAALQRPQRGPRPRRRRPRRRR